jgi:hypothetical protein
MIPIKRTLHAIFFNFLRRDTHSDAEKILLAKFLISNNNKITTIEHFEEIEFSVFSQFGEDGIIQWIINKIPHINKKFVEFGVENYRESNTRFLLINNNWRGLVFDSEKAFIKAIQKEDLYWKHDLTAECEFITKENINDIILKKGFNGEIGLLSIDIDGNDYWVWEAINVISPQIVICEYNSVFGGQFAITIPYSPEFDRTKAHYSNLYWGASLAAFCNLAEKKGYDFVGSNSTGINAFFVRKDCSGPFQKISAKDGYVESKIRDSRSPSGKLTFLSGKERLKEIEEMEVYDIESKSIVKIQDLFREIGK